MAMAQEDLTPLLISRCANTLTGSAMTFELSQALSEPAPPAGIAPEIFGRFQLARQFSLKYFDETVTTAQNLRNSPSLRTRRLALRYLAASLLQLKRYRELVALIVGEYLTDPTSIFLMPLRETADAMLEKDVRTTVGITLPLAIILDLAVRNVGERYVPLRNDSYEDFLLANKFEKPSELESVAHSFDQAQLVYYLNQICVPDVMQMSEVFDGSREVVDERLVVCQALGRIDPESSEKYEEEAKNIAWEQAVLEGVQLAEQSRISFDQPAITRWAERELKEDFLRFQALRVAAAESEAAIREAVEAGTADASNLKVPLNEGTSVLTELYESLIDAATMNSQFGLNHYLSMRIRHGSLGAQLRKSVEDHHLVTAREPFSDRYAANHYWRQTLAPDEYTARVIDEKLASFSASVDTFISEIADEYVQIRTESKPRGWLDLKKPVYTILGVLTLARNVPRDASFDDFVYVFFVYFENFLRTELQVVCALIDDELKQKFSDLFDRLELQLGDVLVRFNALQTALVSARTATIYSLDRLKDWFQLPRSAVKPEYSLAHIVDIAMRMLRRLHGDFLPTVTKDVPPAIVITSPHQLLDLSDALSIIFDNIRQHSGLQKPTVRINAERQATRIVVTVENDVAPGVQTPEAEARIERIRESLMDRSYVNDVAREGKSGFRKIHSILTRDEADGVITFNFRKHEFVVRFEFPYVEAAQLAIVS